MADADGWLIDEWTALAVLLAVSMPVAVHAGELVQAQSGRRIRIRTKISGRDIVSDTDLAVERLLVESNTAGRPDGALLTEGDRRPRREWTGSPVA
jgi:fructose-1,6-bisphosphatase/inositol monophosphatase family enzyme